MVIICGLAVMSTVWWQWDAAVNHARTKKPGPAPALPDPTVAKLHYNLLTLCRGAYHWVEGMLCSACVGTVCCDGF